MTSLSIGEVASRTGLTASAIRYYEREGLVPEPQRVGGKRRYSKGAVDLLRIVSAARDSGFTVSEARRLVMALTGGGGVKERKLLLEAKLGEVRLEIERLRRLEGRLKVVVDYCTSASIKSLEECAALVGKPIGR